MLYGFTYSSLGLSELHSSAEGSIFYTLSPPGGGEHDKTCLGGKKGTFSQTKWSKLCTGILFTIAHIGVNSFSRREKYRNRQCCGAGAGTFWSEPEPVLFGRSGSRCKGTAPAPDSGSKIDKNRRNYH